MNAPNFITLPSGLRVNTAHIIHYGQSEHDGQIQIIMTDEPTPWLEDMTADELDALLQPQGTPIVSPIVNLDKLKPGSACQLTYEGQVKHGVIEEIGYFDALGDSFVRIVSNGTVYTLWVSDGEVNRD